jgi:hypothetical protein
MPYLINRPLKRGRGLALIAACLGLLALSAPAAMASVPTSASQCSNPLLSQPFSPFGDLNWYALPSSGEVYNNFTGEGWTLSGGASFVSKTLYDGKTTGYVLDMPSKSTAISPVMCINSGYPTSRMMVRNVVGSEGVYFYVKYPGLNNWKNTGQFHGSGTAWTLATPVNIQTSNLTGWVLGQFEFVAGGTTSDFQTYNFYVDPYSR